jgi:hypothetical protein
LIEIDQNLEEFGSGCVQAHGMGYFMKDGCGQVALPLYNMQHEPGAFDVGLSREILMRKSRACALGFLKVVFKECTEVGVLIDVRHK